MNESMFLVLTKSTIFCLGSFVLNKKQVYGNSSIQKFEAESSQVG